MIQSYIRIIFYTNIMTMKESKNHFIVIELPEYSILDLIQICSHNRHILHGFNKSPRTELIKLIMQKLKKSCITMIPPYGYNGKKMP